MDGQMSAPEQSSACGVLASSSGWGWRKSLDRTFHLSVGWRIKLNINLISSESAQDMSFFELVNLQILWTLLKDGLST